ncbi:autotransporter outer membrane beta-barrel domain-containing protein [Limnobaculum zhutongyuii]|uniref:Autotransporter outer membrane beta-barrel domain-containing protein n=1 Tax=Limnobaculum zhutongyuii TaxID=2498113 RepID=A0A411WPP9_9GAMM|nr:autotransporter outer membrane beta-barrel domain-containing protein [Limnobaculum zhutongyuii]QBH98157.1 autotransporter outer membrane beta-barrel domain-containing protein [Limnobaculum zhutongyuii]
MGESERASYWFQPKAQVIWMGVTADNHTEDNGTRVKFDTDKNVQTRVGARFYANGHSQLDDGKNREFEPFIEANWIHNTSNYAVVMNETKNKQKGTRDIGEVKVGIEGKLNNNLTSWVNVAQQFGSNSYTDTQGMVGIKYSF